MPELPEVESLRIKITPQILGKSFSKISARRKDLRFEIPKNLNSKISNSKIINVSRRSKYLLIGFENHQILGLHLGMSGRFFFTKPNSEFNKHDHVIFDLNNGAQLRFRDPRRFGMLFLETTETLVGNRFLKHLGPEPLSDDFCSQYLQIRSSKSTAPIKTFLMNAKNVVGVGNIYASESLFLAQIHPERASKTLTASDCAKLTQAIKTVLQISIQKGGTTLKDFVNSDESPGLYAIDLSVYGRSGLPCLKCSQKIQHITQTGRSTYFCPRCQK